MKFRAGMRQCRVGVNERETRSLSLDVSGPLILIANKKKKKKKKKNPRLVLFWVQSKVSNLKERIRFRDRGRGTSVSLELSSLRGQRPLSPFIQSWPVQSLGTRESQRNGGKFQVIIKK